MSPGCSESVVTTSSSVPMPSPQRTMLQPSVVEAVSAICSGGEAKRPANACAKLLPLGQHLLEVGAARAPVLELPPLDRLHRLDARARQRARTCPCSGTHSARAQGGPAGRLRGRCDHRLDRRVVGEHHTVDASPLDRPGLGPPLELGAAHEDLVDPADRVGEARDRMAVEVEVAAEDAALRRQRGSRRALDLSADELAVGTISTRGGWRARRPSPSRSTSSDWQTRRWPPRRSQSGARGPG